MSDHSPLSRVRFILADSLNCDLDEITPATSLRDDLGADSLDLVEIVMACEEEFGVQIPDSDFDRFQTVGDVVEYLSDGASQPVVN